MTAQDTEGPAPEGGFTHPDDEKIRIFVNDRGMSRGKYAAAAVHAALTAAGVHPGLPVIVLGASPHHLAAHDTVIRDAGRTEVDPGTITAATSWAPAQGGAA